MLDRGKLERAELEDGTTAYPRGDSTVQVYSAEHIQDMIEEHPEIAKRIIRTRAKRPSHEIHRVTKLQKELEARKRAES